MDLIDEVLEWNRKIIENNEKLIEVNKEWAALMQSLLNLKPWEVLAAQAVLSQPKIIYCKDCKYWKRSSCCEGYCGEIDMEGFDEDHYCGFAERREE